MNFMLYTINTDCYSSSVENNFQLQDKKPDILLNLIIILSSLSVTKARA